MDRMPIVAGQFYPGTHAGLKAELGTLLGKTAPPAQGPVAKLVMAPHAGYVYSGAVAGQTLAQARLAPTLILLGPNHTGLGATLSVWPDGAWRYPGGSLPVDTALVQALLQAEPAFSPDTAAHLREHSLEVQLPFLGALVPECRIVPIVVSERSLERLLAIGRGVAQVIAAWPDPVTLLVSSDMNHFLSHEQTVQKDKLALEAIEQLAPELLFRTVRENAITMCGVLPMTLGLAACRELGATTARVTTYTTSAKASGDYSRVVGYAGAIVE